MTITINGNGTITGISVGGLPNGIVDTDMLADNAVTAAKTPLNTITHYDCWRLTANTVDEDEDPLGSTTTIERAIDGNGDRPGFGTFGNPMTHSGGVFTFPATGYWKVEFIAAIQGSDPNQVSDSKIAVTTDGGSTWEPLSRGMGSIHDQGGNDVHNTNYCSLVVDVTNTSNVKVKFMFYNEEGSTTIGGNENYNRTCMMFTRIGDT